MLTQTSLCSLLLSLETPNAVRSVADTHKIFKRLAKALIRLRVCAGWSEALLVAHTILLEKGAQWLSDRVLDSRPRGRGFESHRRHCVVILEQDTFILA